MKTIFVSIFIFSLAIAQAENQIEKKDHTTILNKSEEALATQDNLEMDQMIIGDYDLDAAPVHKRKKLKKRSKSKIEKKIKELKDEHQTVQNLP